jgi:uncharacterized membrane protein (DUF373 family)
MENEKKKALTVNIIGLFQRFEYFISLILAVLIALVLVVAVIRVAIYSYHLIFSKVLTPMLIVYDDFSILFGQIIALLIIVEFMNSILSVLKTRDIKRLVKDVILITGLAISRKLIILDYSSAEYMSIIAMGILLISIGVFYFLICLESFSKNLSVKTKKKIK